MRLVTAHKILIASGIGMGAVYAVWAAAYGHVWIAVASSGVSAGLAVYLRAFVRKNR